MRNTFEYQPRNPMETLEHYGVLGMKWGHRKNPEAAYAKAMTKKKKLDMAVSNSKSKLAKQEYKYQKNYKKMTEDEDLRTRKDIIRQQNKVQKQTYKAEKFTYQFMREFGDMRLDELKERSA